MKKDKEWLKEELVKLKKETDERNKYGSNYTDEQLVIRRMRYLADQLEEPEQDIDAAHDLMQEITTLSQEDFDLYWNCINDGVAVSELKQKKVVIPQFVADYYETVKHLVLSAQFDKFKYAPDKKVWNWYRECEGKYPNPEANAQLVISMIKLGRYEVEKEKLYIVKLPMSKQNDMGYAMLDAHGDIWVDRYPSRYELTEQEIKAIDERYWAFAEEVVE